jgi:putative addiction module component (TIGR02574 family)
MGSAALTRLQSEALSLSQDERAELARELIRSLDQPEDPDAAEKWDDGILRRLEALDSGAATMVDRDELRRRIKEALHKR